MISIELTAHVIDGDITFPYQNEIENLALETIGTSENIYFGYIPITKDLYVKYSQTKKAWVLRLKGN